MATKKYDSTVARIAGNILSGLVGRDDQRHVTDDDIYNVVNAAWAIVEEVERTMPKDAQ